MAENLKGKNL